MCVICVLRLIVVPLPLGKNQFAVKNNNNNNNNNNSIGNGCVSGSCPIADFSTNAVEN
jgi:hypothetical protein